MSAGDLRALSTILLAFRHLRLSDGYPFSEAATGALMMRGDRESFCFPVFITLKGRASLGRWLEPVGLQGDLPSPI